MAEDNRPRILIIDNSRNVSGAYRSISAFTQKLKDEAEFYFAVPPGCWQPNEFIDNSRIFRFDFIELNKSWQAVFYLPRLILNTIRAIRLIRKYKITIVHVNDLYNMMGILLKICNNQIKLVYHVRLLRTSYAAPVYGVWRYLIKKYANQIVCVSNTVLEDIGHQENATVIYDALPGHWLLSDSKPIAGGTEVEALYIGNYIQGKGQDMALTALQQAIAKAPHLRMKFVGNIIHTKSGKTYFQKLEKFVHHGGLENFVSLAPFVERIQDEIIGCDFVVNFSESESFSMTCLESLACQRPILATDSGGPAEIVSAGKNGLLVPNRDINAMCQALITLASDSNMRAYFSSNSRIGFRQKFNLEHLSKKLLDAYLNLQN